MLGTGVSCLTHSSAKGDDGVRANAGSARQGRPSARPREVASMCRLLAVVFVLVCFVGVAGAEPKPDRAPDDLPAVKIEVTGILVVEEAESQDPKQTARPGKPEKVFRIKDLDDYDFCVTDDLREKAAKLANKKVMLDCYSLFGIAPPPSFGGSFTGFPLPVYKSVRFSLVVRTI